MLYGVSKLKTVAECDQALAMANARKADLVFEQTVASRELQDQQKSTALSSASLVAINAQVTGTQAAIDELEEGDAKREMQSKLRRLNDRKDNLVERLEKGGSAALLDTELDAGLLVAQVAEIDLYVTAVTNRKAEL